MQRQWGIHLFIATMAVLSSAVNSLPALAREPGTVECGVDGGATFRFFDAEAFSSSGSHRAFVLDLPVQSFRAGIYSSSHLEVEPSFAVTYTDFREQKSHAIRLGLDILANFGADPRKASPFVGIGVGDLTVGSSGYASVSQVSAKGTVGLRAPVGDRWAVRVEGVVSRNFNNDNFAGSWDLGPQIGLSFFTK